MMHHTMCGCMQGWLRRETALSELANGEPTPDPHKFAQSFIRFLLHRQRRDSIVTRSYLKKTQLWGIQRLTEAVPVTAVKVMMMHIYWSFEDSAAHRPIVQDLLLSLTGAWPGSLPVSFRVEGIGLRSRV